MWSGKRFIAKLTLFMIFSVFVMIAIRSPLCDINKGQSAAKLKSTNSSSMRLTHSNSHYKITMAGLRPSLITDTPSDEPPSDRQQNENLTNGSKQRLPAKVKGKKHLYLKLLTRPFSKIYAEPNDKKVKFEKVDTFRIYYAYTTPDQTPGFYEVGTDDRGNTIGYMKTEDVIEWKQYLSLKFTNKEEKHTLFFKKFSELENLMYGQDRDRQIQDLRYKIREISNGSILPDDFPVTAVEPPEYVNIYVKPYLLPILDFKQRTFNKKTTRMLKVASAVKGIRKSESEIKAGRLEGALKPSESSDLVTRFKVDVVFVIDTTISMQPYIERTRLVVQEMADSIADVSENISFGLVAYRDDPTKVPGLGYRTKIYCDLEAGANIDTFLQKVGEVREATVSSIGIDEDVWAGIYIALKDRGNLKRRDDANLFIIQIGDAGAHDYSGLTEFNAQSIRQMAEDEYGKKNSRAWIFSIHLKTPEARRARNIRKAEAQFRTMVSKLPGVQFYRSIENGDPQEFAYQANSLVKSIIDALKVMRQGKMPNATGPSEKTKELAEQGIDGAVRAAIRAAVLERIGTIKTEGGTAMPPRDIQAWTLDRDLLDPETIPMEVMLLITRNDLDTLRNSLKNLMRARGTDEVTSEDFFDHLQSVMTTAMREPNMINKGVKPGNLTLGKIGILPEFIEGLPYKTQVLHLSMERWGSMPALKQRELLNTLKSKIAQYEEYYKNNDIWIELNEGDKAGDHVTFLKIDRLP